MTTGIFPSDQDIPWEDEAELDRLAAVDPQKTTELLVFEDGLEAALNINLLPGGTEPGPGIDTTAIHRDTPSEFPLASGGFVGNLPGDSTILAELADGTKVFTQANQFLVSTGEVNTQTNIGGGVELGLDKSGLDLPIRTLSSQFQINAGNSDLVELAPNSITATELADLSVDTAAVQEDAITNVLLANMAANTIKGSQLGGDPADLDAATVRTILNVEDGATNTPNAYQWDVANQMGNAPQINSPQAGDRVMLEDSTSGLIKGWTTVADIQAGGSGEVNSATSLGGGLDIALTPNSGTFIPVRTLSNAQFTVTTDVISISTDTLSSQTLAVTDQELVSDRNIDGKALQSLSIVNCTSLSVAGTPVVSIEGSTSAYVAGTTTLTLGAPGSLEMITANSAAATAGDVLTVKQVLTAPDRLVVDAQPLPVSQWTSRDFTLAAGETVAVGDVAALNAAGELVRADNTDPQKSAYLRVAAVAGNTITVEYLQLVIPSFTWDITDGGAATNSRVGLLGSAGKPVHSVGASESQEVVTYYLTDDAGDAVFADIRSYVPLDAGGTGRAADGSTVADIAERDALTQVADGVEVKVTSTGGLWFIRKDSGWVLKDKEISLTDAEWQAITEPQLNQNVTILDSDPERREQYNGSTWDSITAADAASSAEARFGVEDAKYISPKTFRNDAEFRVIEAFQNFVDFEPDPSAFAGKCYVNTTTGTSSSTFFSVTANYLYRSDGTSWIESAVTAAEAGWTVYDNQTGRLYRLASDVTWRPVTVDVVTPEMFGAVGDGIADDTAAIQAWMDYFGSPKTNFRSRGEALASYRITDTVTWQANFCDIQIGTGGMDGPNQPNSTGRLPGLFVDFATDGDGAEPQNCRPGLWLKEFNNCRFRNITIYLDRLKNSNGISQFSTGILWHTGVAGQVGYGTIDKIDVDDFRYGIIAGLSTFEGGLVGTLNPDQSTGYNDDVWENYTINRVRVTNCQTALFVAAKTSDQTIIQNMQVGQYEPLRRSVASATDYGPSNSLVDIRYIGQLHIMDSTFVHSEFGTQSGAVDSVDDTGNRIVSAGHPFNDGDSLYLIPVMGSSMPSPLVADRVYLALGTDASSFQLAERSDPATPIDITDAGSGSMYWMAVGDHWALSTNGGNLTLHNANFEIKNAGMVLDIGPNQNRRGISLVNSFCGAGAGTAITRRSVQSGVRVINLENTTVAGHVAHNGVSGGKVTFYDEESEGFGFEYIGSASVTYVDPTVGLLDAGLAHTYRYPSQVATNQWNAEGSTVQGGRKSLTSGTFPLGGRNQIITATDTTDNWITIAGQVVTSSSDEFMLSPPLWMKLGGSWLASVSATPPQANPREGEYWIALDTGNGYAAGDWSLYYRGAWTLVAGGNNSAPGGLEFNRRYYAVEVSDNTFGASLTPGGAKISLTSVHAGHVVCHRVKDVFKLRTPSGSFGATLRFSAHAKRNTFSNGYLSTGVIQAGVFQNNASGITLGIESSNQVAAFDGPYVQASIEAAITADAPTDPGSAADVVVSMAQPNSEGIVGPAEIRLDNLTTSLTNTMTPTPLPELGRSNSAWGIEWL